MPRPPARFRSWPFAYHQELELTIADLTNLGLGLARVPAADLPDLPLGEEPAEVAGSGWVVMVPFALPGERVRVRVFRNQARYSEADLLAVLEPSPQRVEPGCPLYGTCGGCQYQHFHYDGQLVWKQRQVADLFGRLAGVPVEVEAPCPSPAVYGYRSKLTPHWQRAGDSRDPGPIGFLKQGQRRVIVDVPHCPIATNTVNAALPEARDALRKKLAGPWKKKRPRGGTLLLRDTDTGVETDPDALALVSVDGLRFQFKAGEFFQNNPHILPAFVRHVVGEAAAPGIRFLVDAYCGVGLFALSGARRFERVAGVEVSAAAIELARANATMNGLEKQARFLAGDATRIFEDICFDPGASAVVLDPPRKGCDRAFLDQLVAFGPARVVYVSCDPATQARDVRVLTAAGYRPARVRPFDLFPQTRHIECVATLVRKDG
ncbi:MAG: class I SAM-dependent RNA methyltransferase [Opitutales bacterium]